MCVCRLHCSHCVCTRVCVCVCVCVLTSRDGDWWYAENTAGARCGYIPNNFVAEVNSIRQFEYVQTVKLTDSLHGSQPRRTYTD